MLILNQLINKQQKTQIISMYTPKKISKSLPPLTDRHHSYIQRTLKLLQDGCYKDNTLKIDGDIGDYRMKLFRKRDKEDYAKNIHSVFTNTFNQSIMPSDPTYQDVRNQITSIIKRPNRTSLTPQPQQIKAFAQRQVSQYKKGDIKDVQEQQEYLLYKYLPEYQRKRWFEVKSKPIKIQHIEEKMQDPTLSNKNSYSIPKRPHHKARHIFAYLQHPSYLKTVK